MFGLSKRAGLVHKFFISTENILKSNAELYEVNRGVTSREIFIY